jgi:hypothetical protein
VGRLGVCKDGRGDLYRGCNVENLVGAWEGLRWLGFESKKAVGRSHNPQIFLFHL